MTERYQDARRIAILFLKQFPKPSDDQISLAVTFAKSAFAELDDALLTEDLKVTLETTTEEYKKLQNAKTYVPWLTEARGSITFHFWLLFYDGAIQTRHALPRRYFLVRAFLYTSVPKHAVVGSPASPRWSSPNTSSMLHSNE